MSMAHVPYFASAAVKDIASTQSSEGCRGQCSGYHWLSGYPHGTPQSNCWHRQGTWQTFSNTIPSMAQQKCFWLRTKHVCLSLFVNGTFPRSSSVFTEDLFVLSLQQPAAYALGRSTACNPPYQNSPSKMYSCSIFFLAYVPENRHTVWGVWHKHQEKKYTQSTTDGTNSVCQ